MEVLARLAEIVADRQQRTHGNVFLASAYLVSGVSCDYYRVRVSLDEGRTWGWHRVPTDQVQG